MTIFYLGKSIVINLIQWFKRLNDFSFLFSLIIKIERTLESISCFSKSYYYWIGYIKGCSSSCGHSFFLVNFIKNYFLSLFIKNILLIVSKVNDSLITGLRVIDSILCVGRGQRQLILGDRYTGKTSIFLSLLLVINSCSNIGCIDGFGTKRLFGVYRN